MHCIDALYMHFPLILAPPHHKHCDLLWTILQHRSTWKHLKISIDVLPAQAGKGQEDHSKWAVSLPDTSASVGVEVSDPLFWDAWEY